MILARQRKERNDQIKKYYVDGNRITEKEAKEIESNNQKYLNSGDLNQMLKIKFIVETN